MEKLLTDYIQIDHGLLDLENLDILRSAVELIVRIARESSSSYQSEIIEQLLSKVPQEDPQRNRVLLSGIHSILQLDRLFSVNCRNASFILSYKEIDQLIRCYTIDDIRFDLDYSLIEETPLQIFFTLPLSLQSTMSRRLQTVAWESILPSMCCK